MHRRYPDLTSLGDYVQNASQIRKAAAEELGCHVADVKTLITSSAYGASARGWMEEHKCQALPKTIRKILQDQATAFKRDQASHPDLLQKIVDLGRPNPRATLVACLNMVEERKLLDELCQEMGKVGGKIVMHCGDGGVFQGRKGWAKAVPGVLERLRAKGLFAEIKPIPANWEEVQQYCKDYALEKKKPPT